MIFPLRISHHFTEKTLGVFYNSYFLPARATGDFGGFPDHSTGKESACNAGDPSSIPGSGSSAGEGVGYTLWYSWAFLVIQMVKNLPAVQETWV